MKKIVVPVLLLLSLGAAAQKPCVGGAPPKNDPDCITAAVITQKYASPPLKCGKYEQEMIGFKDGVYVPICIDKMHEVTEKQWQELMDRLRILEQKVVR